MGPEPAFRTMESASDVGGFWRALADLGPFGWLGRLWFGTLADTAGAREQVRLAREDHEALKVTRPYAQVLQAVFDDPEVRLVDADPAQGEQVLVHAACFDGGWIQLRGSALAQARFLRLYCASRFRPFRRAYTYDLQLQEICRHDLPGAQWHREVPFALW